MVGGLCLGKLESQKVYKFLHIFVFNRKHTAGFGIAKVAANHSSFYLLSKPGLYGFKHFKIFNTTLSKGSKLKFTLDVGCRL